ncbi:alpha-1,2-fucosyltransferase [Aquiluna sp.]|nr:alpha-1,2-fucosyltransferase [Aquiluna sp.]
MWSQLISGGLGNQLFMVAAAAHFISEMDTKAEIFVARTRANGRAHSIDSLNLSELLGPISESMELKDFGLSDQFQLRFGRNRRLNRIEETGYVANPTGIPTGQKRVVFGYFQSSEYMRSARRSGATFNLIPQNPSLDFNRVYNEFNSSELTWIHLRRGDYARHRSTIGLLGEQYFVNAVERAIGEGSTRFVITSDERRASDRLVKHLPGGVDYVIVDDLGNFPSVDILCLASLSGSVICSNSSFGWWAAMGGRESKFVIAPEPWYLGLPQPSRLFLPSEAVRLSADFI